MTASPMIEVEPYIVKMIGQLAKMRQSITCRQGLELANSLVEAKSIMTKVNDWRLKHFSTFKQIHKEGAGSIVMGPGYWRGFMQRNGHLVKAKPREESNLTSNNLSGALFRTSSRCSYDEVYEELAKTGNATKLE